MKLTNQAKYFINGIVLIIVGLFCVTFAPSIVKSSTGHIIQNYIYYQIEFFTFCAASIFYLFSPKFFKGQILTILLGILYYILFMKFY